MDWKLLPIPATNDGGFYLLANHNGRCRLSMQVKSRNEYNDTDYTHYMGPLDMPPQPKVKNLLSDYYKTNNFMSRNVRFKLTEKRFSEVATGKVGTVVGFLEHNENVVLKYDTQYGHVVLEPRDFCTIEILN